MIKALVALILIYAANPAWAGISDGDDAFADGGGRERASISDLMPDFDGADVQGQCEGTDATCGKHQDANSCIKANRVLGCIWSSN